MEALVEKDMLTIQENQEPVSVIPRLFFLRHKRFWYQTILQKKTQNSAVRTLTFRHSVISTLRCSGIYLFIYSF